jgi:hypothetical protein
MEAKARRSVCGWALQAVGWASRPTAGEAHAAGTAEPTALCARGTLFWCACMLQLLRRRAAVDDGWVLWRAEVPCVLSLDAELVGHLPGRADHSDFPRLAAACWRSGFNPAHLMAQRMHKRHALRAHEQSACLSRPCRQCRSASNRGSAEWQTATAIPACICHGRAHWLVMLSCCRVRILA